MTTLVEAARPEDTRTIARILHGWTQATDWMPKLHTLPDTEGFADTMITRGWVSVVRAPAVCGFLARDGAMIHALYLDDLSRGRGFGKLLLDHAKVATPELTLWTFQQNHRAQAFYLREGFHEVERTDGAGNDEKLPDIRYLWQREGQ